jgi:hypothetical protein
MPMRPPMPASGESAMQATKKISFKTFLAGLAMAALCWGMFSSSANAQENPKESTTTSYTSAPKPGPKRYFVEFRSRSALSYGHTFLVHGKLNANGQVGQVSKEQVAGLHPATDSSVPWMIGHIIPVVSEQGWSDGDNEDEYITAAYRITLTEQEYAQVSAYIRQHQKNSPLWHAVLYNCNAWVGDVAKYMGLKAPDNTLLFPEDYITKLAELNGGKATRPNPHLKPAPLPGVGGGQAAARPKPAAKPAPKPQTVSAPAAAPAPQTASAPAAAPAETVR